MEKNRETIINELNALEKFAGVLNMMEVQVVLNTLIGSLYINNEDELSAHVAEYARKMSDRSCCSYIYYSLFN